MTSPALKTLLLGATMLGLPSTGALAWLISDGSPIVFQSAESSTEESGPVFNRIRWESTPEKDTWIMQQKQKSWSPGFHSWDRLAIVVDKSTSPKTARFYQLEPGASELSGKELNYKVACGVCHTNGPRAIRPMPSAFVNPSLKDTLRIQLWNLRIKTYGRVVTEETTHIGKEIRKTPFRFGGHFANQTLKAKTCATCHNESAWGRGELSLQNFPSIRFLMEKGAMPPPGFSLSEEEQSELEAFLAGATGEA